MAAQTSLTPAVPTEPNADAFGSQKDKEGFYVEQEEETVKDEGVESRGTIMQRLQRQGTRKTLLKEVEKNVTAAGGEDADDLAILAQLARSSLDEKKQKLVWRKRAICAGLFAVVWSGALFGLMIASQEITKEMHVESSSALVGEGNQIVMTREAAETKVSLFHASVMDMQHLREISEITFTTPNGRERSERIASAERNSLTNSVTFKTLLGNEILVDPSSAFFLDGSKENAMPLGICAQMKCATIVVGDLDAAALDRKLEGLKMQDHARRLSASCKFDPVNEPPCPCNPYYYDFNFTDWEISKPAYCDNVLPLIGAFGYMDGIDYDWETPYCASGEYYGELLAEWLGPCTPPAFSEKCKGCVTWFSEEKHPEILSKCSAAV